MCLKRTYFSLTSSVLLPSFFLPSGLCKSPDVGRSRARPLPAAAGGGLHFEIFQLAVVPFLNVKG